MRGYSLVPAPPPSIIPNTLLLASGSRQVCEFCESETAFGEMIDGVLLSLLRGRLEMISCVGLSFSPVRDDDEKERVFLRDDDALRE